MQFLRSAGVPAISIRSWSDRGKPLLLAHGRYANSHWWDATASKLAGEFATAALDFRGHGDSEWAPDGRYSPDELARDLETARSALGWERMYLCAHSMGARVAVSYAKRHPERLL